MKKTKKIVICAVLSALGFGLIALFSFFETLNISVAFIVSILIWFICVELDFKWAIMTYIVVSVLCVLLLGFSNFASFCFIFYIGHYPILKVLLDKLPKAISIILKIVITNALLVSSYFLFKQIIITEPVTPVILIVLLVGANLVYIIGDRFYDVIKLLYLKKFRRHVSGK